MLDTTLSLHAVAAARDIPRAVWGRLCPPDHPFLNADFLAIAEAHGAAGRPWGWIPNHLVVQDGGGKVVGLLPLYLRFNSLGDFTYDGSWASAYHRVGRDYYPRLLSGLPHTPAAGPRLLVDPDAERAGAGDRIRRALIDGAIGLTAEHGLSSWHVAFPAERDQGPLRDAGLLASHQVQFHWLDPGYGDFDGYLAGFTAEKRRKVRAERRRALESGLEIETRHGDTLDPAEWPALHRLYAATFEKYGNHPVFSVACFAELAAALGRRMVAFIARRGGRPVAVSLCFRDDGVLYGRYWGSAGDYPGLHFELCYYRGIDYCLREGLRRFEPGAGGEHKLARGFTPTVLHAFHWIADPDMRALIGRHLARQGKGLEAYRAEAADHLPFRRGGPPGR